MNLPIIKDSRGLDTIMEHAAHEAGHYTLIRLLRNLYRHRIQKIRIIDATVVQTYGAGGRVRARYYRRDRVVLDAASTLEEKEPALLVLLAGVAGETLWRYLYGERRVEEGVEDLGPGIAKRGMRRPVSKDKGSGRSSETFRRARHHNGRSMTLSRCGRSLEILIGSRTT